MGIDYIAATTMLAPAISKTMLAAVKKPKKKEGSDQTKSIEKAYVETLEVMRKMIHFTAVNRVEDVQHITTGWIPHPPSCIVKEIHIPDTFYPLAARHISENLGKDNLERVGPTWWQWRKPGSMVRAEWVEMRSDYEERMRSVGNKESKKVMFYVHGGAYFFGGIGHGPQIQRHARKLKGRVFAPRYRLAPQFPFPCAVQDVLSAYLYLLTLQDPSTIVISGDSAGGGLCLALLIILRDQGLPLPAGASLISPWVDLTHSFPSITIPTEWDYVPSHGFHAKPSMDWPPPNTDEIQILGLPTNPKADPDFEIEVDGRNVVLREQFQMYAPNMWLQIPLISGILAASLGGLCPLQIICGGGEVLRDEQIYLAHKAANPPVYPPSDEILIHNGDTYEDVIRYPPTDVQLLIFEDGPHAAPTLGHTAAGKYEYRAVSQFTAWALAKAQGMDLIRIESVLGEKAVDVKQYVGKAGDPIPEFKDHMIRLRVDKEGKYSPMEPATAIRACNFSKEEIGFPKAAALKGWLKYRHESDIKYAAEREKVWKQRQKDVATGYMRWPDGEIAPPSALAGRVVIGREVEAERERGRLGKGLLGGIFGKLYQEGPPDARMEWKSKHPAFT